MKKDKKQGKRMIRKELQIPTHIFRDRTLSVLESLSEYLHKVRGLTYHEIAVLLNRDDRTIWTCCHRARIKREKVESSLNSGSNQIQK